MYIPIVPHVRIENKKIVYSDTVLPLKSKGNNLKLTRIDNVSEYLLEDCLKTIFESNPDVIFNTVQYSKNDKTVYFYANKEINTTKYKNSKVKKYKPISSSSQILEEVKSILTSEKNLESDCISLYDIAVLMSKTNHKYDNTVKKYEEDIEYLTNEKIIIYDFDYDYNELMIGVKSYGKVYKKIIFKKKNGDLYISKAEYNWAKDILESAGTEISKLYDDFLEYKNYKEDNRYGVKPINSNFLVDISYHGVSICATNKSFNSSNDFELSFPEYYDENHEYKYDCNSTKVMDALKGSEKQIFKRIFVKIDDCPKWMQEKLYKKRQKELAKEEKRAKRLELRRKIFPFLNK